MNVKMPEHKTQQTNDFDIDSTTLSYRSYMLWIIRLFLVARISNAWAQESDTTPPHGTIYACNIK